MTWATLTARRSYFRPEDEGMGRNPYRKGGVTLRVVRRVVRAGVRALTLSRYAAMAFELQPSEWKATTAEAVPRTVAIPSLRRVSDRESGQSTCTGEGEKTQGKE